MAKKIEKKGVFGVKTVKLTPKMERFCQEYLIDFNASGAARRAGYKLASAHVTGQDNIRNPIIQKRINELQQSTANQFNITKASLVTELLKIARADVEKITDPETGAILPVHSWPEDMKGVISGIETDEFYEYSRFGKTPVGQKIKVRMWEKTKAVEILNKMLGFNMPDKVAQTTPEGEAVAPVINITIVPPKNDDDV